MPLPFTTSLLQGDAGPLLVDVANKEQADILVLGADHRAPWFVDRCQRVQLQQAMLLVLWCSL